MTAERQDHFGAVTSIAEEIVNEQITIRRLSSERPIRTSLIEDIELGFKLDPMELPPKYFYDVDGSGIFEKITELPEYYVTRAEADVLQQYAGTIMARGSWPRLVELGSGASKKTRALIDAIPNENPIYSPFDISESALMEAATTLVGDYKALRVEGFIGDFLTDDINAVLDSPSPKLIAFLGSTLGNLTAQQRTTLYEQFAARSDPSDGLLIGVDLIKDPSIIEPAYNDQTGVTAEFNKNVLRVMQRELSATVKPEDFRHFAPYVTDKERIEMRLYAERDVHISFPESIPLPTYSISQGSFIRTELSQKFSYQGLRAELLDSGLSVEDWWTDDRGWVGLALVGRSDS